MEPKEPNVCVDFDGVLAEFDFQSWLKNKRSIGAPIFRGRTLLQELQRQGVRIIIHTARIPDVNSSLEIGDWLYTNDMPYDDIWTDQGKPSAAAYVDDRAVEVRNDRSGQDVIDETLRLVNQWRGEATRGRQNETV